MTLVYTLAKTQCLRSFLGLSLNILDILHALLQKLKHIHNKVSNKLHKTILLKSE